MISFFAVYKSHVKLAFRELILNSFILLDYMRLPANNIRLGSSHVSETFSSIYVFYIPLN